MAASVHTPGTLLHPEGSVLKWAPKQAREVDYYAIIIFSPLSVNALKYRKADDKTSGRRWEAKSHFSFHFSWFSLGRWKISTHDASFGSFPCPFFGGTPRWWDKPSPASQRQHSSPIPTPGSQEPSCRSRVRGMPISVGHPVPTAARQESARSTYVPDAQFLPPLSRRRKVPFFI